MRARLENLGLDSTYEKDILLLELLAWFKSSFFTWVDRPSCRLCKEATVPAGPAEPTIEELAFGGTRVENYFCSGCSAYTRFTRYNNPSKLLQTKCGRCGEWANCFCAIVRALGFEMRKTA